VPIDINEIEKREKEVIFKIIPFLEAAIDKELLGIHFKSERVVIKVGTLRRSASNEMNLAQSRDFDAFLGYDAFPKFFREAKLYKKIEEIYMSHGWKVKFKKGFNFFPFCIESKLIFTRNSVDIACIESEVTRNDLIDLE